MGRSHWGGRSGLGTWRAGMVHGRRWSPGLLKQLGMIGMCITPSLAASLYLITYKRYIQTRRKVLPMLRNMF